MMVDMSKVSWLTKAQIDLEAHELLNQWGIFTGQEKLQLLTKYPVS